MATLAPSTSPDTPTRVLLVEGSEQDFRLTCDLLDASRHATFTIDRARSIADATTCLSVGGYDVCLVDPGLPDGEGLGLVQAARNQGFEAPIIMLARGDTHELDLQAMALGVSDFLDKHRIDATQLERSIRYALARHRQAERLSRLAQRDELTGLANRSLFHDRLERALAWARRRERLVAVLVLDLNGFKAVNDRLGHGAGDRLLGVVARRLTGRLRETDTIARFGGDEFALVIENLAKPEHAALVARKLLDTIAAPITLDDDEVTVSASLGVALYPADGAEGADLVERADRAMYRAKAEGGSRLRFSSDQIERRVQRGALLESDLRRALDQGELMLHYQPQVTLRPGSLGIAAMIRWHHPELGLIGPDRFLPLAEDTGLLPAITDWLLGAAAAQARRWCRLAHRGFHLAVPLLSRQQLAWAGLENRVLGHLRNAGLAPAQLELEVPEEVLLADAAAGGGGLAALREIGVRLALDAFGTGPTSLRGLRLGVIDTLKLARELHHEVPDDEQRSAILKAVVTLAKDLDLRVVAEGVDRQTQLAFVRRTGCDAVQAFMSCPPLPAEACTGWLRQAAARRVPEAPPTGGRPARSA